MIKDILERNEKVRPLERQIEALKGLFPGCFAHDGSLDFEELKRQLLGKVSIRNEGYGLNFLGKSYARLLASLDTTTVIMPDKEHNEKPENKNSDNLYISGDNIDALKHLLKSYEGQIKCIYIDPPYNTGSDGFVYNDKFSFTVQDLIDKLSIDEEEAAKILDLTKRKSASHSAWLLFMYPRLQLARDLLTEDGVIFISIDDNEQADLKLLCDEIFGEENFVANIVWQKKYAATNDAKGFSVMHDYIMAFQKTENFNRNLLPRSAEQNKPYKNDDNDGKGLWRSDNLLVKSFSESGVYPIRNPNTGVDYYPPEGSSWRASKETMEFWLKENRVFFGKDGKGAPQLKRYLNEVQQGKVPTTWWTFEEAGHNDAANKELLQLFGSKRPFDTPKPIKLISRILTIATNDGDTVLDFFSGSATTAHALLKMNVEQKQNRKFIAVQIPTALDSRNATQKNAIELLRSIGVLETLDQVGIERIKRAAQKLKEEHPDTQADLGFRHYTLQDVDEKVMEDMYDFNPMSSNDLFVHNDLYLQFGKDTILTTWLVRDGYHFAKASEVRVMDLAGYTGYYMGHHLYLIDPGCGEEAVQAIFEAYEEDASFRPTHVVVFGYNFTWTELENLKNNLLHFKDVEDNLRISVDVRY